MDEVHGPGAPLGVVTLPIRLGCSGAGGKREEGQEGRAQLTNLLDPPASFGGTGLQALEHSAYEEFVGSFAVITASLISFYRKNRTRRIHSDRGGTGNSI